VPAALLAQLADGGRLVLPIAFESSDVLTLLRRRGEELTRRAISPCRFVPLIGEEGF
jgi:protein-L-isoaspartate(D-aspartate) O-methyltransferase